MVCVQRPDGRPRCTVDPQLLNKYCKREEWITKAPAKQARSVPKHCWKTVTDAWNGYHSVPLRQLAFEAGKLEIVKAIKEGVEIFD